MLSNIILVILCASCTHRDLLKPAYGINFKKVGTLECSSSYYDVTLYLDLPDKLERCNELKPLLCPTNMDDYTTTLCKEYVPVFDMFINRTSKQKFKYNRLHLSSSCFKTGVPIKRFRGRHSGRAQTVKLQIIKSNQTQRLAPLLCVQWDIIIVLWLFVIFLYLKL